MSKRVLILAAHPDDETLGCGATIAKLASAGHQIRLLTFTDGESSRGVVGRNRNTKLNNVSKILGIQSYRVGNFPDNQMDSVSLLEICKFIEANIESSPDMIFTHHPNCLNIDHTTVHRAALTVFRPQQGHPVDFFTFYVPSSTDWNPLASFQANTYFDVEKEVKKKIKALRCYDAEMRTYPHSRSYENVMNLMKAWGSEVGLRYAEKFQCIRRIVRGIGSR